MDRLPVHGLCLCVIRGLPIEGGEIDSLEHGQGAADLVRGDEGGTQVLQHIVRGEQRAEGGYPAKGHLVGAGEQVLQLVAHLLQAIVLQGRDLGGSQVALALLLMDEVIVILVQFAPAGVLLPVVDGHQPVVERIDAGLSGRVHIACQPVKDDTIVFTRQRTVHIAEIEEHPHGHRQIGHGKGALEHLGVQEIEFIRELSAETGAIIVGGVFVRSRPVEGHMLPEGGLLVLAEPREIQDCLQGIGQLLKDFLIGAVPGALGHVWVGKGVRFPAEGFHPGGGLCFLGDGIFVRQAQHLPDAFAQLAGVRPGLAETVVELGHGIEQVVPGGGEIAVQNLGTVLVLGVQHPVCLVEVQGAFSEHPQGQARLQQQDVGIRAPIDALQRGIVFVQPLIGGFVQAGLNLLHVSRKTGLDLVLGAQLFVQRNVRMQPLVEFHAVHFRHGSLLHHGVVLAEQGQEEQPGDTGAFLEQIVQGVHACQRVGHEDGVLQGGVAQEMNLRADFADAGHIPYADLVRAPGALDFHMSLGDQVQCGHGLFAAADDF